MWSVIDCYWQEHLFKIIYLKFGRCLTLFKKGYLVIRRYLRSDMLNLLKRDYYQMQGKLIKRLLKSYHNNLKDFTTLIISEDWKLTFSKWNLLETESLNLQMMNYPLNQILLFGLNWLTIKRNSTTQFFPNKRSSKSSIKENTTILPFSIYVSLKSYVNIPYFYESKRSKSKKKMRKWRMLLRRTMKREVLGLMRFLFS